MPSCVIFENNDVYLLIIKPLRSIFKFHLDHWIITSFRYYVRQQFLIKSNLSLSESDSSRVGILFISVSIILLIAYLTSKLILLMDTAGYPLGLPDVPLIKVIIKTYYTVKKAHRIFNGLIMIISILIFIQWSFESNQFFCLPYC